MNISFVLFITFLSSFCFLTLFFLGCIMFLLGLQRDVTFCSQIMFLGGLQRLRVVFTSFFVLEFCDFFVFLSVIDSYLLSKMIYISKILY